MDNFIVSARKYRPATFDMVVGQDAITSTLKNAIRNNMLAQAFLFTGPRGVGKTTCARIMAKTINCMNPTADYEACDECESCVSFRNSASFNIHELDAASNNSVDDIRNLVDQVRIPPQVGKYKIYIIDEVHMLSSAAFNAFLKTLEEPPAYAKFILATTEKHKIIPTILSRCQIFDFKRITIEDIKRHLQYVAKQESVEAEAEALDIIAQKADGALRDALSIFDQMVSFSGNTITYKNVIENLNVLDYEYYFQVTNYLLNAQSSDTLLLLNEVIDNGFDGQHFLNGLSSHFRNLLVSTDPHTVQLLEVSSSLRERYASQAAVCTPDFLINALNLTTQCDLNYARSSNKRLLLELTLLQISGLKEGTQPTPQPKKPAKPVELSATSSAVPKSKLPPAVAETKKEESPKPPVVSEPSPSMVREADIPLQTLGAQKAESPVAQVTKPSSARTISISASLEKEAVVEEEKEIATEFTNEQLSKVWMSFAEAYESISPSFASAVVRYEPVLKENFEIHFDVPNSIVFNDKINVNAFLDYLKTELQNTRITLHPNVSEIVADQTPYLDSEKFQKMAAHNPALTLFKDKLNLETEI